MLVVLQAVQGGRGHHAGILLHSKVVHHHLGYHHQTWQSLLNRAQEKKGWGAVCQSRTDHQCSAEDATCHNKILSIHHQLTYSPHTTWLLASRGLQLQRLFWIRTTPRNVLPCSMWSWRTFTSSTVILNPLEASTSSPYWGAKAFFEENWRVI